MFIWRIGITNSTVIDEPFLFTDSYKCTMHWATHIREFIRAENL